MDELHKKILRENRTKLVNEIVDVGGICDYLEEKEILTNHMVQDILAETTPIKQARKLLDTIPRRGPHAFDTFCNVLIKTKQRHLAEMLNPDLKNAGVTALPPEPGTAGESKVSKTKYANGIPEKKNEKKLEYPVPVQLPIKDNKPASSVFPVSGKPTGLPQSELPQPAPMSPGEKNAYGSQPTTPNDEKYVPAIFRQGSREVTHAVSLIEDNERLKYFPQPVQDWPYKLDMSMNSSSFQVKFCEPAEVRQQLSDLQVYPMGKDKIKRALIINNLHFDDDKYAERKLADVDFNRIYQTLKGQDFNIRIQTNLNHKYLMKVLEKERAQEGGKELCVFVLIIMSYGSRGTVMCTDGEQVPIEDILSLFSVKNCPLMAGVPKIFLLQACGTILRDYSDSTDPTLARVDATKNVLSSMESLHLGKSGASTPDNGPEENKNVTDTKASLHTSESANSLSDPLLLEDTSDMLVAMATTADQNHASYSSLFLLGLSYLICNYAKSDHFLTLIKGVNQLKASDDGSDQPMKLCEFKHSFTKKLFLLPGYKEKQQSLSGAKGDSNIKPGLGSLKTKS